MQDKTTIKRPTPGYLHASQKILPARKNNKWVGQGRNRRTRKVKYWVDKGNLNFGVTYGYEY